MHLPENTGDPQPHKDKSFNNHKQYLCSLMFKSTMSIVKKNSQINNISWSEDVGQSIADSIRKSNFDEHDRIRDQN